MIFESILFSWGIFFAALSIGNCSPKVEWNATVVSRAITTFGNDLLKKIDDAAKPGENVLISPFNLYSALALIHLGAAGKTREELRTVLGIPYQRQETSTHEAVNNMISRLQANSVEKQVFTKTAIANGLFVQKNSKIKNSYVKEANRFYNTTAITLDFAGNPESATRTVNEWISNKTQHQIPKMYTEPIDRSTSVLLACALNFNGKWKEPFLDFRTRQDKFITKNDKKINVQMMNNVENVPYIRDRDYEAIRIPFEKSEYEMIVVLPTNNQTLKKLIGRLKGTDYEKLFNDQSTQGSNVNYTIPRMKFSWSQSMTGVLARKVTTLFDESADLSNLVDSDNLHVSDIQHVTDIEVDEEGTKASAITGIKLVPLMSRPDPLNPIRFTVNRPFLMMIYYRPASVLLFCGSVYNPVSSK